MLSIWQKIAIVGVSGGIGAICRLLVDVYLAPYCKGVWNTLPTLLINVAGCFLIGLFAGLAVRNHLENETRTFFTLATMTGFCGGFSTFAHFTLDMLKYVQASQIMVSIAYTAATFFCGLACCFFAYWLATNS